MSFIGGRGELFFSSTDFLFFYQKSVLIPGIGTGSKYSVKGKGGSLITQLSPFPSNFFQYMNYGRGIKYFAKGRN